MNNCSICTKTKIKKKLFQSFTWKSTCQHSNTRGARNNTMLFIYLQKARKERRDRSIREYRVWIGKQSQSRCSPWRKKRKRRRKMYWVTTGYKRKARTKWTIPIMLRLLGRNKSWWKTHLKAPLLSPLIPAGGLAHTQKLTQSTCHRCWNADQNIAVKLKCPQGKKITTKCAYCRLDGFQEGCVE